MSTTTNWNVIFEVLGASQVNDFANGDVSGRGLYSKASNTEAGGAVRSLLRAGIERARELARRALARRS